MISYLNGPTAEIISLSARIPVQVEAEAQQAACEYVLYTSVVQKKGGGAFGKLMAVAAAAAPIASMMVPGVGGMGGNYGAMMAGQAVASAASAAAAQNAQQEAMEAINGASEQNIKKGDQVTLEYLLMKPGVEEPFATKSTSAKASRERRRPAVAADRAGCDRCPWRRQEPHRGGVTAAGQSRNP